MNSRNAFAVLVVCGIALVACGSDDADPSNPTADAPTVTDLQGRAFVSTEVTGHDLVDGSEITISFEAEAMSINAGCNNMSSGFTIDEDALTAGPFAMTMMACDQDLMDQDTWVNDFMSDLPRIALADETLTLTGSDATIVFSEVPDAELADVEWMLTGTIANEGVSSVPDGSTASIIISGDTVAVNGGCNTGSGNVTVSDITLEFGPIATTRMACEPAVMDTEAAMLGVLQGETTFVISGDQLTITSSDGSTGLQFSAAL